MTNDFIKKLVHEYPAIREIWLFGSRANGTAKEGADWDYWVFADSPTLSALTMNPTLNRSDIDLLVVYDGDKFQKPWPDGETLKHGTLSGWEFTRIAEDEATYRATKLRDGDEFDSNDFYTDTILGKAIRIYS